MPFTPCTQLHSLLNGNFIGRLCEDSIISNTRDRMIIRTAPLAVGASLLLGAPLGDCLSPSDISSDTPISSLLASAKTHLASGQSNDALTYYDAAVSRDPDNYLTIFQRGATYLSLGKNALANQDFNRVLAIKPDFEGALLQRAKLKGRSADWEGAKRDYVTAGKGEGGEYEELVEAEKAAAATFAAEKAGNWEGCVSQAGAAIMVASTALDLRQLRARCRFERGEVQEGVSDLQHVLQIAPGRIDPHLQISSMLFYSLGDTEKGLTAIRKCLHSDPDSKPCKKLHRQEKKIDKQLKKIHQLRDKRQFNSAVKLLVGAGEDAGLIDLVKEDMKEAKADGMVHKNSPNEFHEALVEMTCDSYVEVRASIPPFRSECANFRPDEQQTQSDPILRRKPAIKPQLPPRPHLQSATPARRRGLRASHPHPQPRQRAPPLRAATRLPAPESAHAAQTLAKQGLLQGARSVPGRRRSHPQARIPHADQAVPPGQGGGAGRGQGGVGEEDGRHQRGVRGPQRPGEARAVRPWRRPEQPRAPGQSVPGQSVRPGRRGTAVLFPERRAGVLPAGRVRGRWWWVPWRFPVRRYVRVALLRIVSCIWRGAMGSLFLGGWAGIDYNRCFGVAKT